MDHFNFLPAEITIDILTRLPTESVLRCKSVCTNWRNLISNHPSFSKMHLNHLNHSASSNSCKLGFIAITKSETPDYYRDNEKLHYFEIDESTTPSIQRIRRIDFTQPLKRFVFVGSCDGLICLTRLFHLPTQPVCICNPITKQYVVLPEIKIDSYDIDDLVYWTWGFGYVSSTNEYKVVGIHRLKEGEFVQVQIYTLGSGDGWRNLGNFYYQFTGFQISLSGVQAIFADGTLYWFNIGSDVIVAFDLAKEKFCEHFSAPPLPSADTDSYLFLNRLGVLDGFLYFAVPLAVEDAISYDIWLPKKKNDNNHDIEEQLEEHQSSVWSKSYRINDRDLFAVTKSGSVLTYVDNYLNIYDTKLSTSKRLVDFKEQISDVFPYKSTLVSLKELGEQDIKRMESIIIEETCEGITSLQL